MKKLFFIKIKKIQAFTLIETLVSVALISLVILGPLSVAITSASYAKNTKDAITATYLAHEGIELVRFKRDSTYVECQNNTATCTVNLLTSGGIETIQQAAWRLFKERFGIDSGLVSSSLGLQPSCFTNQSIAGCAFDVYGIVNTGSGVGQRVRGDTDECSTLYTDTRIDQIPPPYPGNGVGVTDHIYVCKEKGITYSYTDSSYKRVIKLTSTYVSTASQYTKDYEDDVRVDSVVTYTRGMGLLHTVRAIDYLHARP